MGAGAGQAAPQDFSQKKLQISRALLEQIASVIREQFHDVVEPIRLGASLPHDCVPVIIRVCMNVPLFLAAATGRSSQLELVYIWEQATSEAKIIIF